MKILTAAQMQRLDRLTTERYGIPSLALMENAGRGVTEFLVERFSPLASQAIVILCGRGNNGGDGMVVARLLVERGIKPRVLLLAPPESLKGDAAVQYERIASISKPEIVANSSAWHQIKSSLAPTTLIIDAIFGTGLSKPLEGYFKEVASETPNACPHAKLVSIDLPSGVLADRNELIGDAIRADFSVTFTAPKIAHVFSPAAEMAGDWILKEIGTPREAFENDPELFLNLTTRDEVFWVTRPRARDAHKGAFGHVLVIAGSMGKTGAAALAAKAAYRAGAGLVTVATGASALPLVASLAMEVMTTPLSETRTGGVSLRALDEGALTRIADGKTVIAIGPGLGQDPETVQFVRRVVNEFDLPIVLDADGLNAFAGCADAIKPRGRFRVLTPHPGEMARLTGLSAAEIVARPIEVAREFARKHEVHLVLKGHRTLTATPGGEVWVNPTGNPGMATGGSGDVLTGVIAGLIAQFENEPKEKVVAAGVYLHGLAGDLATRERGEISLIAGDILEHLPNAFLSLANSNGTS